MIPVAMPDIHLVCLVRIVCTCVSASQYEYQRERELELSDV